MGIWQKTLFYLGLVDEDDPGLYRGEAEMSPSTARQVAVGRQQYAESGQRPAPTVQPRTIDVGASGDMGRPDVAVRRHTQHRAESSVPRPGGGVQGRRVEPPLASRRRTSTDGALAEAGVVIRPPDTPLVRTVSDQDLESEVIVATSYSDAQLLADHIRSSIPVVLDLRKVEPAMVRRLVDFSSGLTYALGGSMRKIGQGVILVTPANVNLSRDERRRLKDLGYYQAREEG